MFNEINDAKFYKKKWTQHHKAENSNNGDGISMYCYFHIKLLNSDSDRN